MSNNNEKDDNLTVSRVYETLKSPIFLKNLYWDILSGIKEKNTYKLMREIAEGVIDQNMEILERLNSNNEEDNMRRKAIVAEISVMSYTIDKVFSKILYMKLEKVCKEQILKIIQELKDEGKIPENVWSRFKMNHPDIAGFQASTTENKVTKAKPFQQKKVVQVAPTRVGSRRRKVNSNYSTVQDTKKDSNEEILDDLKKVNGEKYSEEDNDSKKGNIQKESLRGKVKEFQNENMPSPGASSSSIKFETHSVNQGDSDAESEISFGRVSPVSSVHTSDLSSFDDVISLSSDDENGEKKTVPLKEALKKYSETEYSDFSTDKKPDIKSLIKSPEPKDSMNDAGKIISQAASDKSPSANELPKRARKPNSKYSSSNMFCAAVKVKERKKPFPLKTYEKTCRDQSSPQKKKVKLDDDIYVDVCTITQSMNEGNSDNSVETPAKQPETPESFKPHSANRSLTSRRTAPVTLFST